MIFQNFWRFSCGTFNPSPLFWAGKSTPGRFLASSPFIIVEKQFLRFLTDFSFVSALVKIFFSWISLKQLKNHFSGICRVKFNDQVLPWSIFQQATHQNCCKRIFQRFWTNFLLVLTLVEEIFFANLFETVIFSDFLRKTQLLSPRLLKSRHIFSPTSSFPRIPVLFALTFPSHLII